MSQKELMDKSKKNKILLIEENKSQGHFLEAMLEKDFEVVRTQSGQRGFEFAQSQFPDVIVLDVILPILSGYDSYSLLKKNQKTKDIPLIVLSSKDQFTQLIPHLSMKPDDFLPKPFNYKDLLYKINAHIHSELPSPETHLNSGGITIDLVNHEVFLQKKRIHLTLSEYDLLCHFIRNPSVLIPTSELIELNLKSRTHTKNLVTLEVLIHQLRKKIPELVNKIKEVSQLGYRFEP